MFIITRIITRNPAKISHEGRDFRLYIWSPGANFHVFIEVLWLFPGDTPSEKRVIMAQNPDLAENQKLQ